MERLAPMNHMQPLKRSVIMQREQRDSVDNAKRWTFPTAMLLGRSITRATQLPAGRR